MEISVGPLGSCLIILLDVFFTSDLLGVANARPLEVSTGYDDGNNGVSIEGVLGTATQSLYGIRSGERKDTTTEAEHVTLPPWNPGQARTVNLVDPSAQTEEEEDKGVSPAVAFVICFVTLSVFGGGIAFVIIRHRRKKKKGKYSPADFQPAGDEEEGLLEIKETAANSNHDGMPTAKPRQGPKKNKQGGGSDEENEETPMLQQEAPLSVTTAPGQTIEMDSFDKDGKPFPMIDEEVSDDENYPTLRRLMRDVRRGVLGGLASLQGENQQPPLGDGALQGPRELPKVEGQTLHGGDFNATSTGDKDSRAEEVGQIEDGGDFNAISRGDKECRAEEVGRIEDVGDFNAISTGDKETRAEEVGQIDDGEIRLGTRLQPCDSGKAPVNHGHDIVVKVAISLDPEGEITSGEGKESVSEDGVPQRDPQAARGSEGCHTDHHPVTTQDDAEEDAEDNSSILRPKKPARTHETTTGSLVLEGDSPGLDLPREVLTESQVIEMMDKEDSEEGREASWSPSDLEHTVPVVPAELQKQGADKSLDTPVRPESQDGAVAPDTQAAKAAEGAEDAGDAKEPDTAQSGKSDAAKAGSSSPADDDSEGDEAATQRDIQVTAEVYTPPEATPSGQKGSNAGGDESEARQEPEVDGTPAEAVRSESADASQQQSSGQASTLDTQVSLSDASETDSTPSEVPVDDVKPAVTPPLPEGDAPPVPERSAKKENEVKH